MDLLNQLAIDPKLLLVHAAGFLILVAILKKFAFGPVTEVLETRRRTIQSRLDDAEAKRAEMEQLRNDYEQRLADIEHQARERIQAAVREAHAARDELMAHTRSQAELTMERARQEAEREKEKALIEIRDRVAELAALAAGQIIHKTIDPATHRQLVDEVIQSVRAEGRRADGSRA